MMNAAIIQNNTAVNIIYITQPAMDDFIQRGMELIDVEPLGIQIGDYRRDNVWYRNLDGQEVALPVPEDTGPSYDDLLAYYNAMKEAVE
mgnify:CR=1 FL=1